MPEAIFYLLKGDYRIQYRVSQKTLVGILRPY